LNVDFQLQNFKAFGISKLGKTLMKNPAAKLSGPGISRDLKFNRKISKKNRD